MKQLQVPEKYLIHKLLCISFLHRRIVLCVLQTQKTPNNYKIRVEILTVTCQKKKKFFRLLQNIVFFLYLKTQIPVTSNKFHTKAPQILGATTQNLVALEP